MLLLTMRCENTFENNTPIDDLAQNLAASLNLPVYNEDYDGAYDENSKAAYLNWVSENYGHEVAMQVLMILAVSSSLAFDSGRAIAQDQNEVPPTIEVPYINLDEVQASSIEAEAEDIHINNVEELVEKIKKGVSSKVYRLTFDSEDLYFLTDQYLKENQLFFSTGNELTTITPEVLRSIFGDDFIFFIENDTQGVRSLNESRRFINRVSPDQIRSNIIITDSEILSLDDGLIKKTDTITNPNGIITETVSYSADWTYNAENTVTGKALASGRSALTVRPTFLLTSPVTRQKSTRIIYASYTGGAIVEDVDESTDQTEDYIPSFEHEPMFKEGTNNYHGEAVAQNLYLSTASISNLMFLLGDASTFTNDGGFPLQFIKAVDGANKLGANYKVFITESISGAVDRHNGLAKKLIESGISYQDFIYFFGAAGNSNSVVSWESMDPDHIAQVVALDNSQKAYTGYSNYGFNPNLYIGERGSFLARAPIINELGELEYTYISLTGTSMSTPLIAGEAATRLTNMGLYTATLPILFPEQKNVIVQGEIQGGALSKNVASFNDATLNTLLSQIPGNELLTLDSNLTFDSNWSTINGRFYKGNDLPMLQMNWQEFVAHPSQFELGTRDYLFTEFFRHATLPEIYASLPNGVSQKLSRWNTPGTYNRIVELQRNGALNNLITPRFNVRQVSQLLRVGSGLLPDYENTSLASFSNNATLLRETFDPSFGYFEVVDSGIVSKIYLPMILIPNEPIVIDENKLVRN